MNARQTTFKLRRTSALLALALPLVVGSAAAATYDLVAMPFVKAMPDGSSVTMWGFALDVGPASVPSVPGPALALPAGDTSLTINLRNALPEEVSIVIPGQAMPTDAANTPLAPVKFTDGQGRQRARSFTAEAAVGGTQSYTWNNLKSGTYLYHSGTHPQVQVQMGLYGAMTLDAAAGQAYAGVPYASAVTLLFSEIDPALHQAVANGQYGAGNLMTSTIDYKPAYFLINGEPYTTTSPDLPAGNAGETTLLRFLNAGLMTRAPVLQGTYMQLIAEDGNPYPHAREQYSVFLPAMKTVDALFTPAATATYPVYDRRLALTTPSPAGPVEGGMLAFLTTGAAAPGTPVALPDAYSLDEDTALSVLAPGVLGNDSPLGAAPSLVSSVSHGTLSLAGDGSFTYTPATNFSGADSFSYRVASGGLTSAPTTVSLTVNPIADPPVASADAYSIVVGGTLNVALPGVLGNDSDPDGDALTAALVAGPAAGTLTFNPDGSFSYVAPTAASSQSFTYQASDGVLTSNTATVTVTVTANQAPVAVIDSFAAPVYRKGMAYTPVLLAVLANDSDPDDPHNVIDPATVLLPSCPGSAGCPNKGGSVNANADGTISYTPKLNFRGTETFSYRVRDTLGALSNAATVRMNVK